MNTQNQAGIPTATLTRTIAIVAEDLDRAVPVVREFLGEVNTQTAKRTGFSLQGAQIVVCEAASEASRSRPQRPTLDQAKRFLAGSAYEVEHGRPPLAPEKELDAARAVVRTGEFLESEGVSDLSWAHRLDWFQAESLAFAAKTAREEHGITITVLDRPVHRLDPRLDGTTNVDFNTGPEIHPRTGEVRGEWRTAVRADETIVVASTPRLNERRRSGIGVLPSLDRRFNLSPGFGAGFERGRREVSERLPDRFHAPSLWNGGKLKPLLVHPNGALSSGVDSGSNFLDGVLPEAEIETLQRTSIHLIGDVAGNHQARPEVGGSPLQQVKSVVGDVVYRLRVRAESAREKAAAAEAATRPTIVEEQRAEAPAVASRPKRGSFWLRAWEGMVG